MQHLVTLPVNIRQPFQYVLLVLFCTVMVDQTAQAQNSDETGEIIDEVTVTGSFIKREQSSNITVTLDSAAIDERGATNAREILETLTVGQPNELTSDSAGVFNPSFANFANLRSLGGQYTLTLLNGKRMPREPFTGTAVNLNTLPTSALQSVDALPDGASAIYGSDAISGVVNFITYTEFEGLSVSASTTQPTEGAGSDIVQGAFAAGLGNLGNDGYNVFISANYRDRGLYRFNDRGDFLAITPADAEQLGTPPVPGRFDALPGNFRQDGVILNPFDRNCNPPLQEPTGTGACFSTPFSNNFTVLNAEEQWSVFARGTVLLGDNHELALELTHAESEIQQRFGFGRVGNNIEPDNPIFPGNGITPVIPEFDLTRTVQFFQSLVPAFGERAQTVESDSNRVVLSLTGDVGGYNYEVWALRGEANTLRLQNQTTRAGRRCAFMQDGCGPEFQVNPYVSLEEQTDFVRDFLVSDVLLPNNPTNEGDTELTGFGVTLGGDLFELPAGTTQFAFAADMTTDEILLVELPTVLPTRNPNRALDDPSGGERDAWSVMFELLIPVLDNLEISTAFRYDDYDDVGGTFNPKFLVNYDVTDYVNLHASFGTGFRAPTLFDINNPQGFGLTSQQGATADPLLCSGTDPNRMPLFNDDFQSVCSGQYSTNTGGNPDLDPEESEAFSIGATFNIPLPIGDMGVQIDYWDYKIEDVVGTITPNAIFENLDTFGGFITRCDELTDEFLLERALRCDLPGQEQGSLNRIAFVDQFLQNLGTTETSGFDLKIDWFNEYEFGNLSVKYSGTIVDKFDIQRFDGDISNSRLDVAFENNPVFRYRHYLTLGWDKNDWSASLQHQFSQGYEDNNANVAPENFNSVDDYDLFHITGNYNITDNVTVGLQLRNIFDEEPPLSRATGGSISGPRDLRFYDSIGRRVVVTLRADFF